MNRNIFIIVTLSFMILFFSSLYTRADSCTDCHLEQDGELKAPAEAFPNDIHHKSDLTCADCHGGNPAGEDFDEAKDSSFKGIPSRKDIPEFCGSCHADSTYMRKFNPSARVDQLTLYWTSQHGQLLKKGEKKAAICSDCHGIHGILPASHPKSWTFPWNIPQTCGRCHSNKEYMQEFQIPTVQEEDYRQSVHSRALFEKKDLSAPVCNDCHGNHGATPPEVSSISFVCRQCHPGTGELFAQSPHKAAFEELEISECEACHGNHKILPSSDEMLGIGDSAVCIECHENGSEPYRISSAIKDKLDVFVNKSKHAEELLERADRQGVEVSEVRFRLQEAHTLLVQVRNLVHSFSLEKIDEKIEEGDKVLAEVNEAGEAALKEAQFRKQWLVVVTLFILLLAIALFLKIRQIEKKPSS